MILAHVDTMQSALLAGRRRFLWFAAACATMLPVQAYSQGLSAWPSRTVKIVIPQGSGGGIDTLARLLVNDLAAALKQPVIVENKPGASGAIGEEFVAHAPPDGYTLLLAANQMVTVAPQLTLHPGFDALADLVPVTQTSKSAGYMLAVTNNLPVRTLAGLVDYAKKNPGKLSFGSYGVGSAHHMSAELLMYRAGIQMVHVPYKQSPSIDLIAGHIQVLFDSQSSLKEFVRAGKVRSLAVTAPVRSPSFPDLPTLAESYPGMEIVAWHGVWATKGTPAPVIERLNRELVRIVNTPEMRKHIADITFESTGTSAQEMEEIILREYKVWAKVIKDTGIKARDS